MTPLSHLNEAETTAVEDNLVEYRAVSGLAIAGFLLGILSLLGLVHPLLSLLSLAGVIVSVLALRRITEASPALIGRKAALTGLALSLIFGISTPVERAVHSRALRAESAEIAVEWFSALRENRPEFAHRLSQYPTTRMARTQSPLKQYETGSMRVEALRKLVKESPVDLLLKLGKQAHVRWYQNEEVWSEKELEGVRDIYVVTVGEGAQAVSFFVRLGTTRSQDLATLEWQWQVSKSELISAPPPALLETLGG